MGKTFRRERTSQEDSIANSRNMAQALRHGRTFDDRKRKNQSDKVGRKAKHKRSDSD